MIQKSRLKEFYKLYLSKYKLKLFISCFLALSSGIMLSFGPKKIGEVTTVVYQGIVQKAYGTGSIDYNTISKTFIFVFLIYVAAFFFILIEERMITNTIQNSLKSLKDDIFYKLTKIKLSVIEKDTDIKNIYNEIDVLNKYLNIILGQALLLISVIIGSIIFAFTINYLLAILTLIIIPLLTIAIKMISLKYKEKENVKNEKQREMEEVYYDLIYKNKLINILNCNKKKEDKFKKASFDANKVTKASRNTIMNLEPYSSLIGNLVYVLILYVGIYLNGLNMIKIGDIQSFILYNKLIERPVYVLSKISNIFYAIKESFNKIFNFLELEEEENLGNNEFINGDIKINDLEFSYDNKNKVLEKINIDIKKGETVVILGKTGTGKSTIVKLLSRFYDSYSGQITIGNTNIKDIDLYEYRKQIGIVPQDIWLFKGTITENIIYGSINKTEADLLNVCKKIKLDELVRKLPEGYDTKISEDASNISLGIKQLICIARLMLKNPPIIFLDEATNLLDYKTEIGVKEAMDEFLKDKTSVIIAHRLSTINNSNFIIVLDDGKICEKGTSEELLNNKGIFYNIYNEWKV